jgi:DNA-binding Lrp family transcriptional regulator
LIPINKFDRIEEAKGGDKVTLQQKIKMIMIQGGDKGTYKELSDLLGISEPSVVNKLKGRQDFKLKEIRIIAEHYELTPEQIVDVFIRR